MELSTIVITVAVIAVLVYVWVKFRSSEAKIEEEETVAPYKVEPPVVTPKSVAPVTPVIQESVVKTVPELKVVSNQPKRQSKPRAKKPAAPVAQKPAAKPVQRTRKPRQPTQK